MDPRASLEHPGTSWLRMTHFPLKNTLLELLWSQRRRRPPDGQKAANGPFSCQKFPESRRRPQERRRRPPEAQESRRRPQERRRRAARSPESRRWPQTAARKPAPDARRMHIPLFCRTKQTKRRITLILPNNTHQATDNALFCPTKRTKRQRMPYFAEQNAPSNE